MNKFVLFSFFFFFYYSSSFAQQKSNPIGYLNSEKIDLKTCFINPQNIEKININKESCDGEIHITSKGKIEFLSLLDVIATHSEIKQLTDNLLIKIDGKLINDISEVKIDSSFFIYVDTEKLKDVNYLNEKFRDLIIVNIDLESNERKPQVYLRGNQETELQNRKEQLEE